MEKNVTIYSVHLSKYKYTKAGRKKEYKQKPFGIACFLILIFQRFAPVLVSLNQVKQVLEENKITENHPLQSV